MDPDLVRSSGPGLGLQERRPLEPLAHLERGRRLASAGRVHPDLRPGSAERRVDLEPVVGNGAAHQGQVRAPCLMALEDREERLEGGVVARHDEQPARPRVEPVDDPRTQRPAAGRERDPHPEQAVDDGPAPPVLGRVGRQPRRLADDDQVLVPPGELERRPFGGQLRRRHQVDLDPLAARETMRLGSGRPVDQDAPGHDRALHLRPRDTEMGRHHGVQAAGLGVERLGHGSEPDPVAAGSEAPDGSA